VHSHQLFFNCKNICVISAYFHCPFTPVLQWVQLHAASLAKMGKKDHVIS